MKTSHRGSQIHSFSYDPTKQEMLYKASEIAARERRSLSELIINAIEEYVKIHGEGNPNYELRKWIQNPDLKAVPAFFEHSTNWLKFIKGEKNSKELAKIEQQAIHIREMARKRWHETLHI